MSHCKHNYEYTQGYFVCTKCGKTKAFDDFKPRRRISKKKVVIPIIFGMIFLVFVTGLGTDSSTNNSLDEFVQRDFLAEQEATNSGNIETEKEVPAESTFDWEDETSKIWNDITENLPNPIEPEFNISQIETLIFQYTNDERTKYGKPMFMDDSRLANIARGHSEDMGNRQYYSHETPEGVEPTDRANKAGYSCKKYYGTYYTDGIAENIAQGYTYTSYMAPGIKSSYTWHTEESLAHELVDGWMDSPGHRENILNSQYDRLGIGISITQDETVYATQNFC